jgi:hypothetical protein
MGCLRAQSARKQPIFDIFPCPVRGGVKGGVKEKAFFVILTIKAKLQDQGMKVSAPEGRRAGGWGCLQPRLPFLS